MPASTGRSPLRELRIEAGWTQQQLADKLGYLAWAHNQGHAGVNADMVAK
jgi:transcriptional regulator with XRE-family HTH domain